MMMMMMMMIIKVECWNGVWDHDDVSMVTDYSSSNEYDQVLFSPFFPNLESIHIRIKPHCLQKTLESRCPHHKLKNLTIETFFSANDHPDKSLFAFINLQSLSITMSGDPLTLNKLPNNLENLKLTGSTGCSLKLSMNLKALNVSASSTEEKFPSIQNWGQISTLTKVFVSGLWHVDCADLFTDLPDTVDNLMIDVGDYREPQPAETSCFHSFNFNSSSTIRRLRLCQNPGEISLSTIPASVHFLDFFFFLQDNTDCYLCVNLCKLPIQRLSSAIRGGNFGSINYTFEIDVGRTILDLTSMNFDRFSSISIERGLEIWGITVVKLNNVSSILDELSLEVFSDDDYNLEEMFENHVPFVTRNMRSCGLSKYDKVTKELLS
ncbi:unnamed protein product [Ambrosiozyma monospora]|uniref:Unnamed protein product n=1 Tax=Ambrosiozyma monospora TaxID=43982 RepID=A0ACB5TA31_AMBMO|nr:unnamed protein product [Ambrosiozyma monospora]